MGSLGSLAFLLPPSPPSASTLPPFHPPPLPLHHTCTRAYTTHVASHSIGPVDLTSGTVGNNEPVPTVTDNLFSQGTISVESIGISYEPTTTSSEGTMNGELTFGGVDTSK